MAQGRQLHLHSGGGLVELAQAQEAGGIVRVEGARSSCASGMPSPSLSRVDSRELWSSSRVVWRVMLGGQKNLAEQRQIRYESNYASRSNYSS